MSQRVPWSTIAPGDFVLGERDGQEWRVEAVEPALQLTRAGRNVIIPLPPGSVLRLATAAEASERALAVAQVKLGGRVVAIDDGDERGHRCPATFIDGASLSAHLYLFHGNPELYGVGNRAPTMRELEVAHAELHAQVESGSPRAGTTKHWHDPHFDQETR